MAGKRKYKKRKRGYRKFFSHPKKGCRPYSGLNRLSSHTTNQDCYTGAFSDECSSSHQIKNLGGFCGFQDPPMRPIRVLSLFDGIGSGLCVLDNLNIEVEAYFSSEVDGKALRVLKFQHNNRLQMVGEVRGLHNEKLAALGRIDLLLGGSPCSDLSLVNPNRRGLHDPSSSGFLFFDFHRILQYLINAAKDNGHQFYWLFENTFSMEKKTLDEITRCLGCLPVARCASQYVPMRRKRYFWSNLLHSSVHVDNEPDDLQTFLKPYRQARVTVMPTLTSSSHSQLSGKTKDFPVTEDGVGAHLFITEQEALFGFPPHYTDGPNLSISDRRKLIGKAWCIPVVCDLLRPLCLLFKTRLVSMPRV